MRLRLTCLVITSLLAAGGSEAAESRSPTFGVPADTFLTGCELILFGEDVPPMARNGQTGYWVVKTDSVVAVNGIVITSLSPTPAQPARPISPEIRRGSEIIEEAADIVWRSRESHKGLVTMDGETHSVGDEFSLSLPAHGASVKIKLYDASMTIVYEDRRTEFPLDRPVPRSQAELDEIRLNGAYESLVHELKAGCLVIRGASYTYIWPLSRSAEIRAALAEMPAKAEIQLIHPDDGPYYKAIRIGGMIFDSSAIRDFIQE